MDGKSFGTGLALGGLIVYGLIRWRIAKSMPKTRWQKFWFIAGHLIARIGAR